MKNKNKDLKTEAGNKAKVCSEGAYMEIWAPEARWWEGRRYSSLCDGKRAPERDPSKKERAEVTTWEWDSDVKLLLLRSRGLRLFTFRLLYGSGGRRMGIFVFLRVQFRIFIFDFWLLTTECGVCLWIEHHEH